MKQSRLETKLDLMAIIEGAFYEYDDYASECHNNGIEVHECVEAFVADAIIKAGYKKQNEWISVDDKFPKHCQKVLVCDERHNMVTAMYVAYDNGGFDWCTSVRLVYKVTHWMPLPEAPKMKGGAK